MNHEKLKKEVEDLARRTQESSRVDPAFYQKYDVKRGLRDITGKGVLAGLTQIGDVISHTCLPDGSMNGPGELIYRGIDINEITNGFLSENRFGFEEVTFLLLFGKLPKLSELEEFKKILYGFRHLADDFIFDSILKLTSRDIMNAMAQSVLALYTLDDRADDTSTPNVLRQSLRLIALFPVLAAYCYRAAAHRFQNKSLIIHTVSDALSTAENFLRLLREDSQYTPMEARLLDLSLVLHVEHGGGNNSSFTTHVVSSSGTDTYSAITAALGSLKGPRHGGANIKVVQMFDEMKQEVKHWDNDGEIADYLTKLLQKEAFDHKGLIYGVGHAVYSVSDPRAVILRSQVSKLAKEKDCMEEFDLYQRVERIAPEVIAHHRKMYKGVCANVDFYSGFLYRLLNIPSELYTPLFAMARIVGWSAHRMEELITGGKIIRPAYMSVADRHSYVPFDQR